MTPSRFLASLPVIALLAGCAAAVTVAPGADKIRMTGAAADVASCRAVGNVDSGSFPVAGEDATRNIRNEALGLGGDTVLITYDPSGRFLTLQEAKTARITGIAYRCAG